MSYGQVWMPKSDPQKYKKIKQHHWEPEIFTKAFFSKWASLMFQHSFGGYFIEGPPFFEMDSRKATSWDLTT